MEQLLRLIPAALVIFLAVWGGLKLTTQIDRRRDWGDREV